MNYPAASYGVSARSYSMNAASSGELHPKRLKKLVTAEDTEFFIVTGKIASIY